jgi:hypothetical protein
VLSAFARASTFDETTGVDAQYRDLKAVEGKKIFAEQASSVAQREQLKAAIDDLREDGELQGDGGAEEEPPLSIPTRHFSSAITGQD